MARITDEMLMAYADGVLAKEEAGVIERALANGDDEVRKAIDAFRRSSDLTRKAFAGDAHEPIPDALVDMVLGNDAKPTATLLSFPKRAIVRHPMALAASIVAVVALATGLTMSLREPATVTAEHFNIGPVPPGSTLATLLATKPSSVPLSTGARDGTQFMVVGTFFDKSNRVCRETELMDPSLSPQQVAVACRTPKGDGWTVEGIVQIAAASSPETDEPGYTPAGASEADAIEGLHVMLGAKHPLSADEERRLMDSNWTR